MIDNVEELNIYDPSAYDPNSCDPLEITKNRQGKHIQAMQKSAAYTIYLQYKDKEYSKTKSIQLTSADTGLSQRSIWRIINEIGATGIASTPSNKRRRMGTYDKLTEEQKLTVRRLVHGFIVRNESPSLRKLFRAINEEESLPEMSYATVYRVLKRAGFFWNKDQSHEHHFINVIQLE